MKYNVETFVNNIEYLTLYGYEPEITIRLKNNQSVFVIAYRDFLELTDDTDVMKKLNSVRELLAFVDFENVIGIEGDIDFEFPVQSQSIVVDGNLWINARNDDRKNRRHL